MKSKGKFVLKGKETKYVPQGMITALATPFTSEQQLDESGLRNLVEWQIKSGMHGLMVTGGCGEFVSLSDDERKRVLQVTLEAAAGRVPVIAGILSPSTRHAVELARHAQSAGASAALILTPYYINPSMDGVYQHYATIAEKTSIPIILYNNPGRTKIDLDADILDRLAGIPTVVGVKECQRDIGWVSDRIRAVGNRIAVLAGDDDIFLPMYSIGSPGMIGVTPLVTPEPLVEMWNAMERGEWSKAVEIHLKVVVPVLKAIFIQGHPAPIKRMMAMAGHPIGPARSPLTPPSAETEARMEAVLRGLK